jgi:dihydrofolate reductase
MGPTGITAPRDALDERDKCHLFVWPVLVGGGKRAVPAGVHAELELLDERRSRSGVVDLHYRL